jgi:hypothetical protein
MVVAGSMLKVMAVVHNAAIKANRTEVFYVILIIVSYTSMVDGALPQ